MLKKRIWAALTALTIAFGGLVVAAPAANAATITCPATGVWRYQGTGGSTAYNRKFKQYSLEKLCTSTPNWYEKTFQKKVTYKYYIPVKNVWEYKVYNNKTGKFIKTVRSSHDIMPIWYPKQFYPLQLV